MNEALTSETGFRSSWQHSVSKSPEIIDIRVTDKEKKNALERLLTSDKDPI